MVPTAGTAGRSSAGASKNVLIMLLRVKQSEATIQEGSSAIFISSLYCSRFSSTVFFQISSEAERRKAADIRVQRDLYELRLTQLSKSAKNEIQRLVSAGNVADIVTSRNTNAPVADSYVTGRVISAYWP